ncbi:MAG: aminotransferase class I/II-fold pyridoxal phosphate-dependent enzyme, partial [Paenibacillaceae bacterium]|nr:aminotransferase class I/II-fold pyridoxal phosphate-dependent enzyme [Paenibacillaceae bacterium]
MGTILCAQRMHDLPKQYFATLVGRVQDALAAGHDVINIGQGNPDLPTPAHIVRAMQEAVADARFHRYPPFRGFDFLKHAIRDRYRIDYSVDLDMDEIAIIGGGKTGLVQLPSIFLDAGDVCALPDPGYPDYASGVAIAAGRIRLMPLLQEDGYTADVRALDPPKMIVLNYPHNPTGALAPDGYYDDVIAWAATHGVLVVSDFAYGAIGDGTRPRSFLASPGAKDVGIE